MYDAVFVFPFLRCTLHVICYTIRGLTDFSAYAILIISLKIKNIFLWFQSDNNILAETAMAPHFIKKGGGSTMNGRRFSNVNKSAHARKLCLCLISK